MFTVCSRFSFTHSPMTYHYTYILAGRDSETSIGGPVFIGTARDLKQRLYQHRIGRVSQNQFRLDQLVYVQRHTSFEAAAARTQALKAASPEWIKALIDRKNPNWRDLSEMAKERLGRAA